MPHAPPSDAVSPTATGAPTRRGEQSLRDPGGAEDAAVREHLVERDALVGEHAHAEAQGAEHAVDLRAHEVREREAAVGRAHEQRPALGETRDRLAGEVVVGEQPAARRARPRAPRGTAPRRRRRRCPGGPERRRTAPNSPAHAASSLAPLLQCTIATGSPAGVVTRSSSWCALVERALEHDHREDARAALTLPVRGATEFVATMPVPASPSGGHSGMPGARRPTGRAARHPRR